MDFLRMISGLRNRAMEDLCYVGECSACDTSVYEPDAGYCAECGYAFHWITCGGWHGDDHVCDVCRDNPEEDNQ